MAKEMKTLKFPGETEPWNLRDGRIPDVTADDNDKIMQVVGGAFVLVSLADSAVKTYIDEYINTALGGEY